MRSGGQRPTFEVVGPYAYSNADEAIEMFEAYGRRYYDSQKYEMGLLYARNADGSYAATSIGISKPRQNGKSFCSRDYALDSACIGVNGVQKRVLYSAHHGRTSRAMFKEMCDFVESHGDFRNELDYIYKAGGYEGIYFKHGGCVEFSTRTNSGGRGGTYDIVIVDEAQELTSTQQEAILPVVSAAQEIGEGDGTQVIYLGTPPGKDCPGTVFKGMHDKAHAGETEMWWLEWAVQGESIDDIDIDDVELWYACNPAMGRRMSEAAVRNERDTMSREGFARERLGWYQPGGSVSVLPATKWARCATDSPPEDGVRCFAVKYAPEGDSISVAVALRPRDGRRPHFELVHRIFPEEARPPGTRPDEVPWSTAELARWLASRKGATSEYVIDGVGSAENLRNMMVSLGVGRYQVKIPKPSEVAAANDALLEAIRTESVTYYQDDEMDKAAKGCPRRKIGTNGGWGFRSEGDADACILEAVALALQGARTTRRDPKRKVRSAW